MATVTKQRTTPYRSGTVTSQELHVVHLEGGHENGVSPGVRSAWELDPLYRDGDYRLHQLLARWVR